MIYCVEDDANVRDIEVYALRSTGFEAEGVEGGAELFAALKKTPAELIILDVMLPGEDGLEILKRIRFSALTRSVPVIMATARGEEYDKITGLDSGADDYLVKPFGMMEMVSRVRAVLRRAGGEAKGSAPLSLGGLTLDPASHTVTVKGENVTLTLKEFELLCAPIACARVCGCARPLSPYAAMADAPGAAEEKEGACGCGCVRAHGRSEAPYGGRRCGRVRP